MTTNLPRPAVSAALLLERFGLSFLLLYVAWPELAQIKAILASNVSGQPFVIGLTHHSVLFLLGVFQCLLLTFSRRPSAAPESWKMVLVPLGATFYYLLYFKVGKLPLELQMNLCPPEYQQVVLIVSLVCIVVGPLVALWGLLNLGR